MRTAKPCCGLLAACVALAGCAGGTSGTRSTGGGGQAASGTAARGSIPGGISGMGAGIPNAAGAQAQKPGTRGVCGNGKLTPDEACDDGNAQGGDGCSADCLSVEAGYACQPPGTACRKIAHCGDALVASTEACDDGNTQDGDGCSARCKIELGFGCEGEPSKCSATDCGNTKQEGIEGCDDGNHEPFDGCSATCQTEPNCKDGACTSKCGDGLVLNEECDDGNAKDGDGCSADCKVEKGFTCTDATSCEMRDGHCILRVPAIFRDFDVSHPDFGVSCDGLVPGIVAPMLDAQGKPSLADGSKACIESAQTFAEWYTDNKDNATIVGELTLYENGKGGFVNRWGKNGEQFPGPKMYANTMYGGPAGMGCMMCTPSAAGACLDPCTPWNDNSKACCTEVSQMMYDGNPLFFPIDDAMNALKDMRYRAKIPAEYGYTGWPWEDAVFPGAPAHDFHFTTEVVYWFKYDAAKTPVLDFTGDDDVWVFVNKRLAVDLGGAHVPENGSVTLSPASAGKFALQDGKVYELRVFHAERKVEGSSFRLTLSGFNTSRSDCTPICGDGIVTQGEECDDGTNDGGYEECAPGCVLGPRCGDGVVQPGEDCDDGNRRDGDGCGSVCRNLMVL